MIVGHSLGGNYAYLFVRRQQQVWKDKYIQSLVTIAAPLGGAGAAVHTLAAGDDILEKHASRTASHASYLRLPASHSKCLWESAADANVRRTQLHSRTDA